MFSKKRSSFPWFHWFRQVQKPGTLIITGVLALRASIFAHPGLSNGRPTQLLKLTRTYSMFQSRPTSPQLMRSYCLTTSFTFFKPHLHAFIPFPHLSGPLFTIGLVASRCLLSKSSLLFHHQVKISLYRSLPSRATPPFQRGLAFDS